MTDRRRNLRASDADREQIVERLRGAANEGRLRADEFDDRLADALQARTYGELDAIVADLPRRRVLVKRHGRGTVLRRPSDADREQIVERLRGAAGEGRLLVDEFDERLGQALSARTYRELDAIVADLPRRQSIITRPGRAIGVLHRGRLVKRARRAGAALVRSRSRALVAGALATAAVAAPLAATDALSSRPSAPAPSAAAGHRCTTHWTPRSKWLPCGWPDHVSNGNVERIDASAGLPEGQ